MEVKTIQTFAIAVFAMLFLSIGVLAQTEDEVVNTDTDIVIAQPGIGPDSIFYGLDKASDRIRLAFILNKEKRAERALTIAEERLAEAKKMLEEGKSEEAEKAMGFQNDYLLEAGNSLEGIDVNTDSANAEEAIKKATRIQNKIESHSEKVAEVKSKILTRLAESNMSEEQLAHLEDVFNRIINKSQEMEEKTLQKKENAKIKYKVLANKTDEDISNIEKTIEKSEGLKKDRKLRAEREIAKAEQSLRNFEEKVQSQNITEFDPAISAMNEKISRAKEVFAAEDYDAAGKIAREVREFGEKVSITARKLREAKEEGNFEEALGNLREKAIRERVETIRKIEKIKLEREIEKRKILSDSGALEKISSTSENSVAEDKAKEGLDSSKTEEISNTI